MIIEGIKTVGLCGRSGSGKGYISKCFEMHGIPAIDTDQVYRELIGGGASSECVSELVTYFGPSIVDSEGKLVRKKLAGIVFAPGNSDSLKILNSITHKYILAETIKRAKEYKTAGVRSLIIDAPVLFESGFSYWCDVKICVTAPEKVQIRRICERDGIMEFEAKRRLDNQMSEDELRRLCDYEIVNDGTGNMLDVTKSVAENFGLI
ncbi:MAG: dephospho-CoA kinase [Clostridia bacterium]|nr:dephospho-CoA kinase [Clostridia bacterium]